MNESLQLPVLLRLFKLLDIKLTFIDKMGFPISVKYNSLWTKGKKLSHSAEFKSSYTGI
jgi:hypothetical protein